MNSVLNPQPASFTETFLDLGRGSTRLLILWKVDKITRRTISIINVHREYLWCGGESTCAVRRHYAKALHILISRVFSLVDTIRPPGSNERAVKMTVECIEDLYPT